MGNRTSSLLWIVVAALVIVFLKKNFKDYLVDRLVVPKLVEKYSPQLASSEIVEWCPNPKEEDESLQIHLPATIYRPPEDTFQEWRTPLLVYYTSDASYDSFLARLARETTMLIVVFQISADHPELFQYARQFHVWAIESSIEFKTNLNRVWVGGDGLGGLVSSFLAMRLKNNPKFSPTWEGQLLVNPLLFSLSTASSAIVDQDYDYESLLERYIASVQENGQPDMHFEKTFRGYPRTVICAGASFDGEELIEDFAELLQSDRVQVDYLVVASPNGVIHDEESLDLLFGSPEHKLVGAMFGNEVKKEADDEL